MASARNAISQIDMHPSVADPRDITLSVNDEYAYEDLFSIGEVIFWPDCSRLIQYKKRFINRRRNNHSTREESNSTKLVGRLQ